MKHLLLLTLLLLLCLPTIAQDDDSETDNALLNTFDLIPAGYRDATYVDLAALRLRAEAIISMEDPAALEAPEAEETLFFLVLNSLRVGPESFIGLFRDQEAVLEASGVEMSQIAQGAQFGQPPSQGIIYGLDFDADAVIAAYTARDFEETTIRGLPALCSAAGCDEGQMTNLENRNPGDIFDPRLGREWPFLLLDSHLAGSPDLRTVRGIAGVVEGDVNSMVDERSAGTMLQALAQTPGITAQVQIIAWDRQRYVVDYSIYPTRESLEDAQQFPFAQIGPDLIDDWFDYDELPAYDLAMLADQYNPETEMQQALILLGYSLREDAETAAEEVSRRIVPFADEILRPDDPTPFIEETLGATVDAPRVFGEDYYVAVISVSYPLPEIQTDDGRLPSSGRLFRIWTQSVFQQTLYPLWQITLPEWAEE